MANFNHCIKALFALEGFAAVVEISTDGYVDPGGLTVYGIARNYNPDFAGWGIVDKARGRELNEIEAGMLKALAEDFYRTHYWNRLQLGDKRIPDGVAYELLESAVHLGRLGLVVEWLQRTLNVLNKQGQRWPDLVVDGVLGPVTLAAIDASARASGGVADLVATFNVLQGGYLLGRTELDPKREMVWRGWLRRLAPFVRK